MIADVSHWHPVIDWTKAKQNSAFLIAKATQGTKYVDPTLKAFIKGCEANEIPCWVFVYLAKGNELAQAKYMVSVCSPVVGKYKSWFFRFSSEYRQALILHLLLRCPLRYQDNTP